MHLVICVVQESVYGHCVVQESVYGHCVVLHVGCLWSSHCNIVCCGNCDVIMHFYGHWVGNVCVYGNCVGINYDICFLVIVLYKVYAIMSVYACFQGKGRHVLEKLFLQSVSNKAVYSTYLSCSTNR